MCRVTQSQAPSAGPQLTSINGYMLTIDNCGLSLPTQRQEPTRRARRTAGLVDRDLVLPLKDVELTQAAASQQEIDTAWRSSDRHGTQMLAKRSTFAGQDHLGARP